MNEVQHRQVLEAKQSITGWQDETVRYTSLIKTCLRCIRWIKLN